MNSFSMASSMRASSEFSVESPIDQIPAPPKRKGGRKPVFTAEARRQRNRDAQAAFRERRTEYIKELEDTVKIYGDKIRTTEAARASTAEDCLMLRYKNSLLERILLHKGIDVQAELNSKLWMPVAPPVRKPSGLDTVNHHESLKRKTQTQASNTEQISQSQPLALPTLQYSPISESLDTSEPTTPPSMAPPTPKRAKALTSKPASYVPTTSYRREDHRKVFPSPSSHPFDESNSAHQQYRAHKSQVEVLSVQDMAPLSDFPEAEDIPYSLGSLDDFDFSVDYSAMAPVSFPTLSL